MIRTVIIATAYLLLADSLKCSTLSRIKDASVTDHYAHFAVNPVPQSSHSALSDVGTKLLRTAAQLTAIQAVVCSGKRHAVASLDGASDGNIDLNVNEPAINERCFMEIAVGLNGQPQRIEIGLYGEAVSC